MASSGEEQSASKSLLAWAGGALVLIPQGDHFVGCAGREVIDRMSTRSRRGVSSLRRRDRAGRSDHGLPGMWDGTPPDMLAGSRALRCILVRTGRRASPEPRHSDVVLTITHAELERAVPLVPAVRPMLGAGSTGRRGFSAAADGPPRLERPGDRFVRLPRWRAFHSLELSRGSSRSCWRSLR